MDSTMTRNLRWICRVCAVNIKEDRNSDLASVHIFGPALINEKLRKYFGIEVHRHDNLPKNICSTCYRKLEAMHDFAMLARKTDRFLKTFITQPLSFMLSQYDFNSHFQKEFASFILSSKAKSHSLKEKAKAYKASLLKHTSSGSNRVNKSKSRNESVTANLSAQGQQQQQQPPPPPPPPLLSTSKNSDKLEEKRQNLKAALATSNATAIAQSKPRIKVKSDSDLRSPRLTSTPEQTLIQNARSSINAPINQSLTPPQNNSSLVYTQKLQLGQVIRDIDLLTLILKALKWPYNDQNILLQIDRLKTVAFEDVISNQNLLQDTDLMQILNTILSPMMLQQRSASISMPSLPQTTISLQQKQPQQPMIPGYVSYKIPADLSVHLITEAVEDEMPAQPPTIVYNTPVISHSTIMKAVRKSDQRRPKSKPPKIRPQSPVEIPSDDSIQMFEVNVDPGLYFTPEDNSNSNDSQRKEQRLIEQNKIRKKQKRKEAHTAIQREELIVPDILPETLEEIITGDPVDEHIAVECTKSLDNFVNTTTANISGDEKEWAEFNVSSSPETSMEKQQPADSEKPEDKHTESTLVQIEVITSDLQAEEVTSTDQIAAVETMTENYHEVTLKTTAADVDIKKEIIPEEPDVVRSSSSVSEVNETKDEKSSSKTKSNQRKTVLSTEVENKTPTIVEKSNAQAKRKSVGNTPVPAKKLERKPINVQSPKPIRVSTRSRAAPQPAMTLRNSNTRRRICKQCGLSFTLLTEFLDHRKMHIQG